MAKAYILYPKDHTKPVKVVWKKPRPQKRYGFAEGSFDTKKQVKWRLNWMNIPTKRRPKGY